MVRIINFKLSEHLEIATFPFPLRCFLFICCLRKKYSSLKILFFFFFPWISSEKVTRSFTSSILVCSNSPICLRETNDLSRIFCLANLAFLNLFFRAPLSLSNSCLPSAEKLFHPFVSAISRRSCVNRYLPLLSVLSLSLFVSLSVSLSLSMTLSLSLSLSLSLYFRLSPSISVYPSFRRRLEIFLKSSCSDNVAKTSHSPVIRRNINLLC